MVAVLERGYSMAGVCVNLPKCLQGRCFPRYDPKKWSRNFTCLDRCACERVGLTRTKLIPLRGCPGKGEPFQPTLDAPRRNIAQSSRIDDDGDHNEISEEEVPEEHHLLR